MLEISKFDKSNETKLIQLLNIKSIVLFSEDPLNLDKSKYSNWVKLLNRYEKLVIREDSMLDNFNTLMIHNYKKYLIN